MNYYYLYLFIFCFSLQRLKSSKTLTPQQQLVLSKRALNLALYIVRSPFFENHSEKHIRAFLLWFVNSVPLVGSLVRPLLEYMQQWQETYFYLWSTQFIVYCWKWHIFCTFFFSLRNQNKFIYGSFNFQFLFDNLINFLVYVVVIW